MANLQAVIKSYLISETAGGSMQRFKICTQLFQITV